MQGDPAAQAALAANPDLDGETATLSTENSQLGAGPGGGGGPPPGSVLNREYVWGPGDRGVDELLVQYDISRNPSWPLQRPRRGLSVDQMHGEATPNSLRQWPRWDSNPRPSDYESPALDR